MKSLTVVLIAIAVSLAPAPHAASGQLAEPKPGPLAHTYSIVARDPITGDMGVAVQSHAMSVGGIVSWGEAGVGHPGENVGGPPCGAGQEFKSAVVGR